MIRVANRQKNREIVIDAALAESLEARTRDIGEFEAVRELAGEACARRRNDGGGAGEAESSARLCSAALSWFS